MMSFFVPAMAQACTGKHGFNGHPSITRGEVYGAPYTQIDGTLGGANYVVRIPDTWNGMLIVGCHAYSWLRAPNSQFQGDALAAVFIAQGYAYASSDFGNEGYCVKDGMTSTYQLTEYVINKYHVTGKIFLFGASMGGEIALLLGEKFPRTYSGILDICGPKDMDIMYGLAATTANSNLDQIRTILGWPSIVPDATVQDFKNFAITFISDIKKETHGTPETKPRAYEKISPVDNAHIRIPVISLVGGADFVVPLSQTYEYQTAVTNAGKSDLYKMIVVPTGGHVDAITLAQAPAAMSQLIAWSNTIDL